jgi:uncharacterized membrane protein
MIPETDLINLDMTVEEAFTLIISGGIASPAEIQQRIKKETEHANNV